MTCFINIAITIFICAIQRQNFIDLYKKIVMSGSMVKFAGDNICLVLVAALALMNLFSLVQSIFVPGISIDKQLEALRQFENAIELAVNA